MRKSLFCLFLFFGAVVSISLYAMESQKQPKSVLLLWWNTENLFDARNDPATNDDDFTPAGKQNWTEKRVLLKKMRIGTTLMAIESHPLYRKYPDIVAFAEVENRDIFQGTLSRVPGISYRSIYYDSPDPRGIDIALAYNPQSLKAGVSKAYSVNLGKMLTRKIIVAGFFAEKHPFYVVLNHWPSRAFDTRWTEPRRIAAAMVARHIVDSLLVADAKADIIVMGDFNDEPGDRSLKEILGSSLDGSMATVRRKKQLYNCWTGYKGIGSYSYHNRWQRIDQILLSAGMLDQQGLYAPPNAFRCFFFSGMVDPSGTRPFPTFEKGMYRGGYSDHLPLLLKANIGK